MIQTQQRDSASLDLLEISSHLEVLGYPKKAIKLIKRCGSPQNMYLMVDCACGTRVIELNHACNKSFCPNCSIKRQRRIRRRFLPYLKSFDNSPTYKWRFLTISPENYKDYDYGKKHIKDSWRKFIRREYIKDRVKGGFSVIEVTKQGEFWNFHIHAIIYSKYLDNVFRGKCLKCGQSHLKMDQFTHKFYCSNRSCNSLYEGIIQIPKVEQEFSYSSGSRSMVRISQASSQSSVLNYMLKYVSETKSSFSSVSDFAYHIFKSYHERPINAFGSFYNFKKQISEHEYMQFRFRCAKCGEVAKFSFDSTVNFILKNPTPDPPPDLNSYFE